MRDYRLFVYDKNGQVIGPAKVILAADDSEAIAQAEALHGSLAAELLDFDGLRIIKRLPPSWKGAKAAVKPPNYGDRSSAAFRGRIAR
jgi:hypothetical protein